MAPGTERVPRRENPLLLGVVAYLARVYNGYRVTRPYANEIFVSYERPAMILILIFFFFFFFDDLYLYFLFYFIFFLDLKIYFPEGCNF